MNTAASNGSDKEKPAASNARSSVNSASNNNSSSNTAGSDISSPKPSRHTKFFSNTVGRLRAHTVASEGNQLDEAMSPTAHANPYFAHQGQPGLRHHNEGSVPPSPPDTPELKICGPDGLPVDPATSETKEELARRLRRVASAPNAQGIFASDASKSIPPMPALERPATAELGKDPLVEDSESGSIGLAQSQSDSAKSDGHAATSEDVLSALPAPTTSLAFRRTYSSNSIKVRNVEVGPASFDKIKLIGKGDVGKVYLVREKKSSRLYAMKGMRPGAASPFDYKLTNLLILQS
jgi:protein-serine/threonine kinase